METTKKLYKIDSKGKTRVWYATREGCVYTTFAGLEDGKQISKTYSPTPKGKNTPEEQAQKDVESKRRKKYERELYSEDLSKPHPLAFVIPMLATNAVTEPKKVKWGSKTYLASKKLNGCRCTIKCDNGKVTLTSRKGKPYTVPHIQDQLRKQVFLTNNSIILDSELYIHGVELGDVTHAVAHGHTNLECRVFDVIDTTKTFVDRYGILENLNLRDSLSYVENVPVNNLAELNILHDKYVSEGYEGIIIREALSKYEHKRSLGLYKFKKFADSEFEIVGVKQDKNGGAILTLVTDSGVEFDSRPMGTDQYRLNLWAGRSALIGKEVTVRYSTLLASTVPEFNRIIPGGVLRDYE